VVPGRRHRDAAQIKRTEGVSTTDIVGRMLTCTRVNPCVTQELDSQVTARVCV
jgi:hypothetical protein